MIYIEWRPFWRQKVKMAPNIKNGAKSQFLVEIFKINKKAAETVLPTSQCVLSMCTHTCVYTHTHVICNTHV